MCRVVVTVYLVLLEISFRVDEGLRLVFQGRLGVGRRWVWGWLSVSMLSSLVDTFYLGTFTLTVGIYHLPSHRNYMGGSQNSGLFLGSLNTRCSTILRTQNGTIILTTINHPYRPLQVGCDKGAHGSEPAIR